jgi:hypothetical protein
MLPLIGWRQISSLRIFIWRSISRTKGLANRKVRIRRTPCGPTNNRILQRNINSNGIYKWLWMTSETSGVVCFLMCVFCIDSESHAFGHFTRFTQHLSSELAFRREIESNDFVTYRETSNPWWEDLDPSAWVLDMENQLRPFPTDTKNLLKEHKGSTPFSERNDDAHNSDRN